MIEGLWSVSFITRTHPVQNYGAGVVVFETQRLFGGDSAYFYTGKYSITPDGKIITAEATITHYFGEPQSIFGDLEKYTVVITGEITTPEFIAEGYLKEDPRQRVFVKLVKRSELP